MYYGDLHVRFIAISPLCTMKLCNDDVIEHIILNLSSILLFKHILVACCSLTTLPQVMMEYTCEEEGIRLPQKCARTNCIIYCSEKEPDSKLVSQKKFDHG